MLYKRNYYFYIKKQIVKIAKDIIGLKGMGERLVLRYTLCDIVTEISSPFPFRLLKI